ncbi:MAG: hypothetical protein K2H93_03730 [Oscillospiraceae bacterium]|nr:hypothetical protein [Oscillospiraceae bacterium]
MTGDEMSEEKEETRIIIVHKLESDNISVCINNPHIDKKDLLLMTSACIAYFIKNMILDGMSFLEAVAIAQKAVTIATDEIADELMEKND